MKTSTRFAIMFTTIIASNIFFVPFFRDVEKFSWKWFQTHIFMFIMVWVSYTIVANFLDYWVKIIDKMLDIKK